MWRRIFTVCTLASLAACADSPPTVSSPGEATPIDALSAGRVDASIAWRRVRGFDNPRGLAFGPDGSLFVAEAGTGGPNQTGTQCTQVPVPLGPYSGGPTARISRITPSGERVLVASGLPSALNMFGDIVGVADVAVVGNTLYALVGGGGCSHGNPSVPNGVIQVHTDGTWQMVADFSAYYAGHPVSVPDPSDFEPDGALYSMEAGTTTGGTHFYFVESNGGAVYRASLSGAISRVRDLSPERSTFSTPTAIMLHEGNVLVGNFGQFALNHSERVRRVAPGAPSTVLPGLDAILGLAVDAPGNLYVLETASTLGFFPGAGRIIRIEPSGIRSTIRTGLEFPTAMIIGPDGALYVSNRGFGFAAGEGEIVRIPLT